MDTVTYAPGTMPRALSQEIHNTRARQFVHRLRWDLCVDECGGEIDQFDDAHAFYVVVREGGQHILSCRIRPASSGTMIETCFPDSFPFAKDFIPSHRCSLWEVTRFCKCSKISSVKSAMALKAMSFELDGFRDFVGATGYIAVVYPHFPRFLKKLGARYLCLSDGLVNNEKVQLICVTHSVDFRGKMSREPKSEIKSNFGVSLALLGKAREARTSPYPGGTYPTGSVTGMPSAV